MHRSSTWKVRGFISDLSDNKYKNHKHVHINLYFQQNIVLLSFSCKLVVLRLFNNISITWELVRNTHDQALLRPSKSESLWL